LSLSVLAVLRSQALLVQEWKVAIGLARSTDTSGIIGSARVLENGSAR